MEAASEKGEQHLRWHPKLSLNSGDLSSPVRRAKYKDWAVGLTCRGTGNGHSLIFCVSRKINFILPLFSDYNALKLLQAAGCVWSKRRSKWSYKSSVGAETHNVIPRGPCAVQFYTSNSFNLLSYHLYRRTNKSDVTVKVSQQGLKKKRSHTGDSVLCRIYRCVTCFIACASLRWLRTASSSCVLRKCVCTHTLVCACA